MTSDALKIARLQARTELTSQILGLASDPLWSTIAGFVTVHELRKRDLVGPVADDILYAGIIAINTARQPALMDLAGKGLSALSTGVAAAGGTVAAAAALKGGQKLLSKGKGDASFAKALGAAGASGGTFTVLPPGTVPSSETAKNEEEYGAAVRAGKWWQVWKAF
jgi:hypothetical protein